MAEDLGKVAESLIAGKVEEVAQMVKDALDSGMDAEEVLNKGLIAGMDVVGQRFKVGDMFIPEVLRSAKAMSAGMEHLRPALAAGGSKRSSTLVIGTVEGDLHDIGKNLVGMMFEGAGFKVVNIGIDLKPEVFVEAVKEHKPDLLGMSALLTTTMPKMGETINALKEAGVRDQVKIIVGGAPVTEEYAKEIGADLYGANAASSVDKGRAALGV
ncbi:MAG TPA: corrinoid protein [Desulfosalsimonadaceae bacterium]|nr:corrinoid protein [Desulfosalsimonadaceae bacterium]